MDFDFGGSCGLGLESTLSKTRERRYTLCSKIAQKVSFSNVVIFKPCLLTFQIDLIHLGAKYAPCMRWDSVLDREIKDDRLKERDTACCIRKDRSGCVQSPKSECSKINDPNGADVPPRSKWVSSLAPLYLSRNQLIIALYFVVASSGMVFAIPDRTPSEFGASLRPRSTVRGNFFFFAKLSH